MAQKKKKKSLYKIQYINFPGLHYSDEKLQHLMDGLQDVAQTCFNEVPNYQVLKGSREDFTDKVITVAWRKDGTMAGFCSTLIIDVKGVGKVQHLGLTCVKPDDRRNGLTHLLTSKAVSGYLVRNKLIGKLWISNCAAVLSSLGNVALNFEKIFPSPKKKVTPSKQHILIAQTIDKYYRDKIYIHEKAQFDADNFVFKGSVKGTCFQKNADDNEFYHRNETLNNYYKNIMDFENGDEVLQIGYVSSMTPIKYMLKRKFAPTSPLHFN